MDILEKTKFASAKILVEINYRTTLGQEFIKRQIGFIINPEDVDPHNNLSFYQLKSKIRGLSTQELRKIRNYELNNKRRKFIISLINNEMNSRLYEG